MNQTALSIEDISVEAWVQGGAKTAADLLGHVVLVEVFQVNCPGCFLYALPEALRLHDKFHDQGLLIVGVATAFEDYDKNTLHNLRLLIEQREVIGETLRVLQQNQLLDSDGLLNWSIPFAVAMDRVTTRQLPNDEHVLRDYAQRYVPGFDRLEPEPQQQVLKQVELYLQHNSKCAETFERFGLRGTPSSLLFNRQGQLIDRSFGQQDHLQPLIESCLVQ